MSLLLTEVKDQQPKKISRSNESMKDMRDEKTQKSSYLIYHQKDFKKTEMKVVEYLLTDETMYTNIDKSEALYRSRVNENKKKSDAFTVLINKLKQEEKDLGSRIAEETVTNVKQDINLIREKYQDNIENLHPEIESFNHSLQVYKTQKDELVKENIRLKQNMNEEYKQSIIRNDQWKKFNIIDTSIKSEVQMKEKLYRTMTNFGYKAGKAYEKDEEKKKHKYALRELQLAQFKEDAIKMDEKLNKLKQRRLIKEKILPEDDYKNHKIFNDNLITRRENYQNILQFESIKESIKAKSLQAVITHFKTQSISYESSYNQYSKLMKDLAEQQGILSSETETLKSIQKMIDAKKEKDIPIAEDPVIISLEKQRNEITEENKIVNQKCDLIELFIKSIFTFINLYHDKTIGIMKSILINSAKLSVFAIGSIDDIIKKYFDNKESFADIQKYSSMKKYEPNEFPLIIQCLLKYVRNWHVIYYNFVVETAVHYCSIHNANVFKGKKFFTFLINDFPNQDFTIETKQKKMKSFMDKLNDKKKILSGIKHSEKQLEEMNLDLAKNNQKTTIETIFKRFLAYYDKKTKETEQLNDTGKKKKEDQRAIDEKTSINILVNKLKNKFFIHLSGFVNELVEKYKKEPLDYSSLHLTNIKPKKAKTDEEEKMIKNIMNKIWIGNSKRGQKTEPDNLDDSYHEDTTIGTNHKKGNKSHYYDSLYINPNESDEKLFGRINDLHKLNFEVFHNQSNKKVFEEINNVCNINMNTKMFFKLMKKPKSRCPTVQNTTRESVRRQTKKKATFFNNTATAETNMRTTTLPNDRVLYPRIEQRKTTKNNTKRSLLS